MKAAIPGARVADDLRALDESPAISPTWSLEVAQFQTENRAQKFRDDFMSLAGSDELDHITGPVLAGVIADNLKMEIGGRRWTNNR